MNKFNTDKLSVEFRNGVTSTGPTLGRRYTLTHSDITAELFLTIGSAYAYDKINAIRDEVLGEWIGKQKNYLFHVYLHIDGNNPIVTGVRNHIFRLELPLALKAIRYVDRKFFSAHSKLDNSPIIVHFMSSYPSFNRTEKWGTFSDYKT
ncbi:staygreen family protein [Clostridium sporogenes]|uniref:staygreen family protein n=1 Tax=Clostridium botulinum TaxID=1491 RepID=UPI0007178E97|nr:staygreen family protein [Clostridium botulinum]KRU23786.1 staygreen family protein [Clostridium sporogenes]KRU29197.1 staygreen family protein [Clostridium sporogenes]KRU31476.1 staygreen family protein [Clostridium sporogenes]KRU43894.1 staygreen family protein [Clostridium sporogenes]MBZ1330288.1 staygreen family protein [Clostridium botulinum]